jgi:predicted transcriptional regulator
MAIQPGYAEAILAGVKTVELRKRVLAPDIETVLVYETSPTKAIVGSFAVSGIEVASPEVIWARHWRQAEISRKAFDHYYTGASIAVAISLTCSRRFSYAVGLAQLNPRPAVPQSFNYLSAEIVEELIQLQSGIRPGRQMAYPVASYI